MSGRFITHRSARMRKALGEGRVPPQCHGLTSRPKYIGAFQLYWGVPQIC